MRAAIRYLAYPMIVIGGAALIIVLQADGRTYWEIAPLVLVGAAAMVAALERAYPYAATWNADHEDTRTDVLHFLGNVAISHASLAAFATMRPAWAGLGLWPEHAPFWAQALLGLAIVDGGLYAMHRASHRAGWLWRLHALHHSSRRLYWVNGQRRHVVHELVEGAPGAALLFVAGAPPGVYATVIAIVTLHLLLQHANLDYRLGPLRWIFAGAELHRWHHRRRWHDVQGNYAAVFAIWDHAFHSALRNHHEDALEVGMDDEPDLPADYVGQLTWPFKTRRAT